MFSFKTQDFDVALFIIAVLKSCIHLGGAVSIMNVGITSGMSLSDEIIGCR